MTAPKLIQIGNSVGVILPKQVRARLKLAANGRRLVATQAEARLTMLALASGTLDEALFAAWLRRHTRPR